MQAMTLLPIGAMKAGTVLLMPIPIIIILAVARVAAAGGLTRFGEAPADPETVGVNRRQFFNRSIVAAQSLVLGSFGLAIIGFLWPSLSGGFGGKVKAGSKKDILAQIAKKKLPFYVPEARAYITPYPESALPAAKKVYSESILLGMEAGL